jgi:hypothetical protein
VDEVMGLMDYQRLLELTEKILILRGSAGSGNLGHDGRSGRLGDSQTDGGLRRIEVKKDSKAGEKAGKVFKAALAQRDPPDNNQPVPIEIKSLLDLTDDILALRGGPTSGNWAHDGRPGRKGGSGRGGGFKRLRLKKGTTSRRDVKVISKRVRRKRKQLKDRGVLPSSGGQDTGKAKPKPKKDDTKLIAAKATIAKAKAKRDKDLGEIRSLENDLNVAARKKDKEMRKRPKTIKALETRRKNLEKFDSQVNELTKKLGGRTSTNAINAFNEETKAASDEIFKDNLKKAKSVRKEIENKTGGKIKERARLKDEEKRLDKEIDAAYKETSLVWKEHGIDSPETKKARDKQGQIIREKGRVRSRISDINQELRKDTLDLLAVDDPSSLGMSSDTTKKKADREKWGNVMGDVNSVVSTQVTIPNHEIKIEKRKVRANASWGGNQITVADYDGMNTIAHEIGHTIEMKNPRVLQRATEWRDNRTKNEDYISMNQATRASGVGGYGRNEITKPDKFFHPYIGKSYRGATEVISMGIGEMISDPVGLMEKDSDMFDFIYAVTRS